MNPSSLPTDPGAILSLFISGLHSGKYALAVAGALAAILWAFKNTSIGSKLPKAAWPWVSTAVSVLGALAANLQAGMPWGDAVWQGLVVGKAAVGLWESTFQHLATYVASKLKLSPPPSDPPAAA